VGMGIGCSWHRAFSPSRDCNETYENTSLKSQALSISFVGSMKTALLTRLLVYPFISLSLGVMPSHSISSSLLAPPPAIPDRPDQHRRGRQTPATKLTTTTSALPKQATDPPLSSEPAPQIPAPNHSSSEL
jgi:hypothetical protein